MERIGRPLTLLPEQLGAVAVIAPHPDDETIGCGGLIALLALRRQPVNVLLLSDGGMSHPRSLLWLRPARARLRLAEFHAALHILGIEADSAQALQWPDGALPDAGTPRFDDAVAELLPRLTAIRPNTLLLPWRRDPHADHRAASALGRAANAGLPRPARLLEYAVWAPHRGAEATRPALGETLAWRVDIKTVSQRKLKAISAHRSQLGGVIHDDPGGFVLPPEMLAACAQPFEIFYEVQPP